MEAATLMGQLGFRAGNWGRAVLTHATLVALFGVALPWMKGVAFLDQVVLGAYACMGVVFAGPAAAQGIDPRTGNAGARILACVFYGEVVSAMLLVVGVATVYATHWGRIFVGPNLDSLARCAALGVSVSLAVSTVALWMAVRFSPKVSRSLLRVVFLAMLGGFYLWAGWLPVVAIRGAEISLAIAAGAYLLLRRARMVHE